MPMQTDDKPVLQHAIVRVIHPRHHIYGFGLRGLQSWTTAEAFNRKHGEYEINRRLGVWTAQALRFEPDMKEAFRISRTFADCFDLMINAETLWRIIWSHAARNDNPKPLTFTSDDLKTFFEPYNCDLNGVHDWLESEAHKFQRAQPLLQTAIAPETNG
jgi:hypothetical protein